MQAIDRTHRLGKWIHYGFSLFLVHFVLTTCRICRVCVGQCRPIRAVRFIAEGTVDERILQLQEKKRLVFDGTVGR